MKLGDKLYALGVAAKLARIVKDIEDNKPTALDYLRYNTLKSSVAQDIFTGRPSAIYKEFFFDKKLEDYIPNKG